MISRTTLKYMKRILQGFLCLFSLFLFHSCEWLNQIQLFPQEITIMEANLDLSEKLGIYEIWDNESPFEMRYIETGNRRLILINSLHSGEGYPGALIIDADSLTILKEYNTSLSIENMQPSLKHINGGVDNEIVGETSLSEALDIIWINNNSSDFADVHWRSLLFLHDGLGEKVYAMVIQNVTDGTSTIPVPPASSLQIGAELIWGEGSNGTIVWPERQLVDTTASLSYSFSNYYLTGMVNDIQEGKSYFYGFTPVDMNSFGNYSMNNTIQVNSNFSIYEVDPVNLTSSNYTLIEGSSNYSWVSMDYPRAIHSGELHYTRKGWVVKKNGESDFPYYYLHNLDTGAKMNSDSVPAANILAACFDFSGEHYYFIDQRSIKLVKAVTPW